jgi:nucleoside-diphosphate kinase
LVKISIIPEEKFLCLISKYQSMNGDLTLSIIKPNAVRTGKIGPILAMINEAGFEIVAMKMVKIAPEQAADFYVVHKDKPFFDGLIEFMISGPVFVMILKHKNAVEEFRKLIGATDPAKAEQGTIRKLFAVSVQMNAIHGSDSDENAKRESDFFFSTIERFL